MSTIRTPVGPQPPSVYWRRRLVVLLALIAVIVVIVLIIVLVQVAQLLGNVVARKVLHETATA